MLRRTGSNKADGGGNESGWGPRITFPVPGPRGTSRFFDVRLPTDMAFAEVDSLPRPEPGASRFGDGRAVLDLGPRAEQAFIMGQTTTIMRRAIVHSATDGDGLGVLATLTVALTDVTTPPFVVADGDAQTVAKALDERLFFIVRICGFTLDSPTELVPVKSTQFRWLSPHGSTMTFSTTRKGMFSDAGNDLFLKIARSARLMEPKHTVR